MIEGFFSFFDSFTDLFLTLYNEDVLKMPVQILAAICLVTNLALKSHHLTRQSTHPLLILWVFTYARISFILITSWHKDILVYRYSPNAPFVFQCLISAELVIFMLTQLLTRDFVFAAVCLWLTFALMIVPTRTLD